MHQNRSVNVHQFTMIPQADIPRSRFDREARYQTTFDADYLIPFMCDEVLPGDFFAVSNTHFARMTTPIYPLMDNLYLDTFYFFVPNRLVWDNWVKMMGEQRNPGDSISYLTPQTSCPASGYPIGSLGDYFGLATVGQVAGANTVAVNALPFRMYNLIYNEWFRDENLQNSVTNNTGDGPDASTDYTLLKRGKRKDYFTSALPWPQKGNTPVTLPIGISAPVYGTGKSLGLTNGTNNLGLLDNNGGLSALRALGAYNQNVGTAVAAANGTATVALGVVTSGVSGLYADLSAATAATINQIRQSFQIQKLLERDARGGTRYTEILLSHFGVRSPDMRLQRPEYLGGSSTRINVNPVAQTSGTNASGTTAPMGTLSGFATVLRDGDGFSYASVEHGFVIGLMAVRGDITYQQGVNRQWFRRTRYDYYWPVFAALGEQAVYNREIYCDGSANDALVFGYQEPWAEYRYKPSMITGKFRSTAAGTLDGWHVAEKFASLPALNATFIQSTTPMSRVLAVGAAANGSQFYYDGLIVQRVTRPMPMFGVPGLIDHF